MLLFLGTYFIFSPQIASYQLKSAMESGDAERVLEMMDMEAIRDNLKKDLLSILDREVSPTDINPFAVIARQYATNSITGIIDTFVTPEVVRMLVEQSQPSNESKDLAKNVTTHYRGLSRFEILLESEDGHSIILELQREEINIMNWKLVRIRVPESYLESMM